MLKVILKAVFHMASLTEASILTRKIVRYGLYLIILIIIARIALYFGKGIYERYFPPEPPKATVAFGKLPLLPFPQKTVPADLAYKLETTDGQLPAFPEFVPVYEMPQAQSSIAGLDAAKQKASAMGFNTDGRLIVENVPNVYLFRKNDKPANFTINIITGVFSISYDLASDPSVLSTTPLGPTQAVNNAQNFLTRIGLVESDLTGAATTEFLRVEKGRFISASSLSEAQITKVNLFRKNYGDKDSIRAVTPDMPESNVWAMFAGVSNEVIAAEYHYFPLNVKKNGTYPIKTAEQAFQDLKDGRGYIANSGNRGSTNEVTIRKVYLGYYDAGQYQPYYQPVVVFEGDGNFWAYVPAVNDDNYGSEPQQ